MMISNRSVSLLAVTLLPRPLGRVGIVVRSRLRALGLQVRDPISLKIRRVLGLLHVKSYVGRPNVLLLVWKFGEGVPAQVSSSSSDRSSKLQSSSQNSPRVASKWDVNITKL
ncbi:hypothetical protein AVEN_182890-1 [Araneus ventricosus]|uniref:Uncharacterized protein n=1 Tax=Araneus ventricosus TaxID=182803 RepID=A0A4Y2JC57_ARAVE|nr:hypothetical protein AVEN_182890-1 [Araneus ventricosus]